MENFTIYYILNILIWGVFLRHQLFVKPDLKESLKNNCDLTEEQIDSSLFFYWLLFTLFWPITIILSFVISLLMIFGKK